MALEMNKWRNDEWVIVIIVVHAILALTVTYAIDVIRVPLPPLEVPNA